jgi:hypothetical protein
MLQTVPADEKAHPVHIKLPGAEAIVKIANQLPDLVEQAGRLQRWVAGFHGRIYTCMKNSPWVENRINKRVQGDLYGQVKPQLPS